MNLRHAIFFFVLSLIPISECTLNLKQLLWGSVDNNNSVIPTNDHRGIKLPTDYPAEEISSLIAQDERLYRMLFHTEILNEKPGFRTRNNNPFDEVVLCEAVESLETPTKLNRLSDNKEMIIAQDLNRNIKQSIRHVKCSKQGPCEFNGFPANLQSECTQEYSVRRMYVFNKENNTLVPEDFLTPSCCNCRLRRIV